MLDKDTFNKWIYQDVQGSKIQEIRDEDPKTNTNPPFSGYLWLNKKTGKLWVCRDNTPDKNVWIASDGSLICPTTVTKFDIFDDNSTLAVFTLDRTLKDLGGQYNLECTDLTFLRYGPGKFGYAVESHYNMYQLRCTIDEIEKLDVLTVSARVKWNGWCCVMPFGMNCHDIYICCNFIGINTGHGDMYGCHIHDIGFAANTWIHLVVEFHNGEYGRFWVNLKEPTYTYWNKNYGSTAKLSKTFAIFGWPNGSGYRHFGSVDQVRIFNRALTDEEREFLYHEVG